MSNQEINTKIQTLVFRLIVWDEKHIEARPPEELNQNQNAEGEVKLDDITKRILNFFDRLLYKRDAIDRLEYLIIFGSCLYRAIFDGDIHTLFTNTYEKFNVYRQKNTNTILRIILEFHEKAEKLVSYPWEYLYYPDTPTGSGFFIGSRNPLVLLRHVPINLPERTVHDNNLRILVVSSSPNDLYDIPHLDEVINAIDTLQKKHENRIKVQKLTDPTTQTFVDEVIHFKPHIVHFIAHGRWNANNNSGEIAFVNPENKKAEWIEDVEFAGYFEDFQPDLIFLHACQGAVTDTIERFKGLALRLVYSNIPAVVAMQYPIEIMIINQFASKFYECLGNGGSIATAVQEGRALLRYYQRNNSIRCRVFGIPVIYSRFMGTESGIITTTESKILSEPPQMDYCPECNSPISATSKRCTKCGMRSVSQAVVGAEAVNREITNPQPSTLDV